MPDNDHTTSIEYREISECPGCRFGSDGSGWYYWPCNERAGGRWFPLTIDANRKGFNKRVWVRVRGEAQRLSLLHLVCWAFHGPCPEGMEWRRIDGDSANDRADNLEWRSWRDDLARGEKRCVKCRAIKPLGEFIARPSARDRLTERCKACLKEDREILYSRPEAKARLKGWEVRSKLKYRYGITEEEFNRLVGQQGGRCALCDKPPLGGRKTKRLLVDHDHVTGRVRGAICHKCNSALGAFGDDLEGIMKVVAYLQRTT